MNPNINYYVNEEKRIVTAVGFDCAFDALDEICKSGIESIDRPDKYLMKDTYTGTAHCCNEDEFDAEVGIHTAEDKLMRNYAKSKVKAMRRFVKDTEANIERVNKRIERYEKRTLNK